MTSYLFTIENEGLAVEAAEFRCVLDRVALRLPNPNQVRERHSEEESGEVSEPVHAPATGDGGQALNGRDEVPENPREHVEPNMNLEDLPVVEGLDRRPREQDEESG